MPVTAAVAAVVAVVIVVPAGSGSDGFRLHRNQVATPVSVMTTSLPILISCRSAAAISDFCPMAPTSGLCLPQEVFLRSSFQLL